MIKKLMALAIASILLGGCTLTDVFKTSDAAKDVKTNTAPTSTPTTISSDTKLEAMPSTTTKNDVTSLEADIDSTIILDEDFSDLD